MRRIALTVVPVLMFAAGVCWGVNAWGQKPPAGVGGRPEPVVSVSLRTLDGATLSSEQVRGRILVVVFFRPGDGTAEAAVRAAAEVAGTFEGRGVNVWGVSLSPDREATVVLLNRLKAGFPVHFDPKMTDKVAAAMLRRHRLESSGRFLILDPDGRVADRVPAAQVLGRVETQLELTPPREVDAGSAKLAEAKLSLAEWALDGGHPWSAARYLAQLPAGSDRDALISGRASALTLRLERAVPELIAETERLYNDGKVPEAVYLLERLLVALRRTPSEAKVEEQLQSFTDDEELRAEAQAGRDAVEAADRLEEAGEHEERGDLVTAYVLCRAVADSGLDTEAVKAARERIAAWEADPVQKRKLRDAVWGARANALLSKADSLRKSNLPDKARPMYERIVAEFPGTTAAERAEAALRGR